MIASGAPNEWQPPQRRREREGVHRQHPPRGDHKNTSRCRPNVDSFGPCRPARALCSAIIVRSVTRFTAGEHAIPDTMLRAQGNVQNPDTMAI
jgi:hypothetical protein